MSTTFQNLKTVSCTAKNLLTLFFYIIIEEPRSCLIIARNRLGQAMLLLDLAESFPRRNINPGIPPALSQPRSCCHAAQCIKTQFSWKQNAPWSLGEAFGSDAFRIEVPTFWNVFVSEQVSVMGCWMILQKEQVDIAIVPCHNEQHCFSSERFFRSQWTLRSLSQWQFVPNLSSTTRRPFQRRATTRYHYNCTLLATFCSKADCAGVSLSTLSW